MPFWLSLYHYCSPANPAHSITKLMGESFRLHAQALVGYVDDVDASDVSTPSMVPAGEDNDESVY